MHLVMFDIDGTLVDSNGFDGDLYARAIRDELGVQVDEKWHSYRHITDSGVLEEVLEQHPPGEAKYLGERVKSKFIALVREYLADGRKSLNEIGGACKFFHRVKSQPDLTVAIATGGWRETAEMKLKAVSIRYRDVPLATSSDATSRIEIMRLAERHASSKGPFSRRIYFGDASWDQKASEELGFEFVGIGSNVHHSVRFDDLSDQDAILSKLGI